MKLQCNSAFFMMAGILSLLSAPAHAGPSYYGTWISAGLSAIPVGARHVEFKWSLDQSALPPKIELRRHHSAQIQYTVQATRQVAEEVFKMGARGEVCVANHGPVRTQGLRIHNRLESANGSEWIEVASDPQNHDLRDINPEHELDSGERHCYPYRLEGQLKPGAEYRVRSTIRISNFVGREDDGAIDVFTPFEMVRDLDPSESNRVALLKNEFHCPEGFACTMNEFPETLTDTITIHYVANITNVAHKRGGLVLLLNTAVLVESDSRIEHKAPAHVVLNTGGRCGD